MIFSLCEAFKQREKEELVAPQLIILTQNGKQLVQMNSCPYKKKDQRHCLYSISVMHSLSLLCLNPLSITMDVVRRDIIIDWNNSKFKLVTLWFLVIIILN